QADRRLRALRPERAGLHVGAHRSRSRAPQGGRGARLSDTRPHLRVCRVQPDVPAIARAFDYLVPAELAAGVEVGTVVRVALHGRRVRGWVVADRVAPETDPERLVPLVAVVSAGPPPEVVELCRWVAWRWAGPVSTVLRAASPPNVVAPGPAPEIEVAVYDTPGDPPLPLPDVPVRSIAWPPRAARSELVPFLLASEGSTVVIVPEPARAGALGTALARDGREVVLLHGGRPDAERTAAWSDARRGARVVVGGRTAVFAP